MESPTAVSPSPAELRAVRARALARFRRMLADMYPDNETLARYRDAQGNDQEAA